MPAVPSTHVPQPDPSPSGWSCCPPRCPPRPSCPSWRACVPSTRRYWDRCTSSTYGVKFCSVLVMLECAYIAITGRGVISILQAIIGVIFAIEGYWGAVRFDRPSIKRFLIFLLCFFAAGLAVGIIDTTTLTEYCSTAADGDSLNCHDTYQLYAIILIIVTASTLPLFFVISTLFYLKLLSVHSAQRRRGHHTMAAAAAAGQLGGGGGYEAALRGYKADEDEDVLYWEGQLFDSDDEEEVAYAGRDMDDAKGEQMRAELAAGRGDKEELQAMERRGSVMVRDSPVSDADESKIDVHDNG